ncbi:MAG: helix-turn-helix transcriptional regulator [Lachnospiraceae bacterium]|nr:helix-turn-helix transcriptional regulator [Lachnospiraceae bacterium]
MSTSYQNVLERLKEERLARKWSQDQISQKLKMSQSHYSKVELGNRRFTYYEVQDLYELELDAHYIFTGQKSSTKEETFFSNCDYRELHFYLHVLAYMAEYFYMVGRSEAWKAVYKELEYIKYVTAPDKTDDNTLFLLRRMLNYSQQTMAEKLGVDIKKVRTMENGESLPDSEILWKLYYFFRIPPAVFTGSQRGMLNAFSCLLDILTKEDRKHALEVLQSCHGVITG